MSSTEVPNEETPPSGAGLTRNVWAMGGVSLFNDTSSEMIYWLLPQFMVTVLGASPISFGLMEGAAETVASLGRVVSGFVADRLGRRKPLAAAGYTLGNVVKPLLAVAQSWTQVFWIRVVDRAAKGFRAAPRDALLADSVPPARRGAAFGFRQAMDSAGAVLGPLAAFLLLPVFHGNVRSVFWAAALPGLISILLAWFAVREIRPVWSSRVETAPGVKEAFRARNGRLLVILVAVTIFSLGNSSDLFLILRAQNLGVAALWVPVLGLVFNLSYTALSWPAGRLSDRIPRRRLIVTGYLVYAAVYWGFARGGSPRLVWLLFIFYGMYYAMTEGVLKAWIADLVPSTLRASVFGIFSWMVGMVAFPASLLAGWLWQRYSPAVPFYFASVLSLLAALLLLFCGNHRAQR
jgi:MFS family permease